MSISDHDPVSDQLFCFNERETDEEVTTQALQHQTPLLL